MRVPTLPASRIVRGAIGATITHQFIDADGEPLDPTGSGGGVVTVAVTRSDGTTVTADEVTGSDTTPRSVTVALAEVAAVDWLTAVWSVDGTEVATDVVEVVGGVLMTQAQAALLDKQLATTAVTAARFRLARLATEDTITAELGRSPFERFYTERVEGSGDTWLKVSWPDVIEVVWARIWSGTTSTSLTSTELASIPPSGVSRLIERTDGAVWPAGCAVELGYRFGMQSLPADLRDNLALALRHHVKKFDAGLPFLGSTLELEGGGLMRQNRAGVGASITGNDDIDARIRAHRFDPVIV